MSPLGTKNCVGDPANLLPLPCPQPITFAFSKRFVTRWIRDNEEIQEFTNYVRTSFHSIDSLKNFPDITYLCFPFDIILLAIIPYTVNKGKRNECKGKEKPPSIHVPTALQSRGDLLAANALSFYTFPREVSSHNVYSKNCLVHKRKLYANGMQIHPRTLR